MPTPMELVDRALALADSCDRQDLHRRLALVGERLGHPNVRVLVVGEPKQGKSQLVNALVGAPVCPVADDVVTTVPTVVRYGESARAELVRAPGGPSVAPDAAVERVPVAVDQLAAHLPGTAGNAQGLLRAEVSLPRKLLSGGLELVDTAGIGGVGASRMLATIDLLPTADAVLVVSDVSQEFTAPEMALVGQVQSLCPNVVCVLTKTDAHPAWRQILELDRGHLAAAGIDAPVLPVTAELGLIGLQRRDRELYAESGIGALTEHLRREVVDRAEALSHRSVVHDLTSVTEHLSLALRTELADLEDPAGRDARVRDLEATRVGIEELRRRSSRWQQVLGDGITDLMSDIDYDLRDRSRVVVREAEEAIGAQDPGALWDEFTDWLDQRVAQAVTDSYVWAGQRSEWLAQRVIDQFAEDGGAAVPELFVGDAAEALRSIVDVSDIDRGFLPLRERVLIGMRGSYTGVLMTGLVTSLAGMGLINPISVAAGVVIGTKAYRDDKAQRRQRRQNDAKAVVRRHLDEVVFQVGKQLKDRLRIVQRTLRDLISDTVDEMSRTMNDALRAAQRSAKFDADARDARIRALRQQLASIDALAEDVAALAASTPASSRPAPSRPAAAAGPARSATATAPAAR